MVQERVSEHHLMADLKGRGVSQAEAIARVKADRVGKGLVCL